GPPRPLPARGDAAMTPVLLTAALALAQPPADRSRDRAGGAATLDGAWAVVAFERGGEAVPAARGAKATIRDNTITFATDAAGTGTGAGGTTGSAKDTGVGPTSRASESGTTVGASLRPVRLEFGPDNTARMTELDAGGRAAA